MLALLMQSPAYAYYIVLDDEGESSGFTVKDREKSNKTTVTQSNSPQTIDVTDQLPTIMPERTNEIEQVQNVTDKKKSDNKKVIRLKRKISSRCPTEWACGGQDTVPVNYSIAFKHNKSDISAENKMRLKALIPRMTNTKVCIVGRPDLVEMTPGNVSKLAMNRAYNIRKFLLNNGIKAETITVSTRADGYTENDGTTFDSDVIIIEKKENIQKRNTNVSGVDIDRYIRKASNVGSTTLQQENAKLSMINSTNETIDFIDHSMQNGEISQTTGSNLKTMLRFNEIRVLKTLSPGKRM